MATLVIAIISKQASFEVELSVEFGRRNSEFV